MSTFTPTRQFDDLIHIIPNAIDKDVCKDIIHRFEKDDRKQPGVTTLGSKQDLKKSIDLNISICDEWKDIDDILFKSVSDGFTEYIKQVSFENGIFWPVNLKDDGYNVKRYDTDGYFHWHSDMNCYMNGWSRIVAFIWYLNDLDSGYTEFVHGRKIYPKEGQLIMFPACWSFPHRGVSPTTGKKYIITSFMIASHNESTDSNDTTADKQENVEFNKFEPNKFKAGKVDIRTKKSS